MFCQPTDTLSTIKRAKRENKMSTQTRVDPYPQYVSGVQNLIFTALKEYQEGFKWAALKRLRAAIGITITKNEELRKKLDETAKMIDQIETDARRVQYMTPEQTRYARAEYRASCAGDVFFSVLGVIRDALKDMGYWTGEPFNRYFDPSGGKRSV